MNALQTVRKNRRKGFTLVEIIVVLVIIAILLAALAPVMIGWIQEARDTTLKAEARLGMNACQSVMTEQIALKGTISFSYNNFTGTQIVSNFGDKFQELIGDLKPEHFTGFDIDTKTLKVLKFTYNKGSGRTVTFDGSTYTVAPTSPAPTP